MILAPLTLALTATAADPRMQRFERALRGCHDRHVQCEAQLAICVTDTSIPTAETAGLGTLELLGLAAGGAVLIVGGMAAGYAIAVATGR